MQKFVGNDVNVYLIGGKEILSGLLIDIDEESCYVQNAVDNILAVPKERIKYLSSTTLKNLQVIPKHHVSDDDGLITNQLRVIVDENLVARIDDVKIDLSRFSDDIVRIALQHPEVQRSLENKIQSKMEFYPNELHIYTVRDDNFSMQFDQDSITNNYLSPLQMVERLNTVARRTMGDIKNEE